MQSRTILVLRLIPDKGRSKALPLFIAMRGISNNFLVHLPSWHDEPRVCKEKKQIKLLQMFQNVIRLEKTSDSENVSLPVWTLEIFCWGDMKKNLIKGRSLESVWTVPKSVLFFFSFFLRGACQSTIQWTRPFLPNKDHFSVKCKSKAQTAMSHLTIMSRLTAGLKLKWTYLNDTRLGFTRSARNVKQARITKWKKIVLLVGFDPPTFRLRIGRTINYARRPDTNERLKVNRVLHVLQMYLYLPHTT